MMVRGIPHLASVIASRSLAKQSLHAVAIDCFPSLRWLCLSIGVLLCLSACGGKAATTPTSAPTRPAPATDTQAPSATLAPAPTETASPTSGPTATRTRRQSSNSRPTQTLHPTLTKPPTATSTPIDPDPLWFVRAEKIPEWPNRTVFISWETNDILIADAYLGNNKSNKIYWDAATSPQQIPAPTPFHNINSGIMKFSPLGTFLLACDKGDLKLYRLADEHLSGQIHTDDCQSRIPTNWTRDESAVAFILSDSVYIWYTNGTQPINVGKIPDLKGMIGDPEWSPDNKKLAIYIQDLTSSSPDTENTYYIVYVDGRPMHVTGVGIGHAWSTPWLTNEIIDGGGSCCGDCDFHNYFIAETGEYLPEIGWVDCGRPHTQEALLSPNYRWFVIDQINPDYFITSITHTFTSTLSDIPNRKLYTLSASTDIYLDYVGWANDSSAFYLIRRPITDTVVEQRDAPFGLLALDPYTRQFRLLNPDIRYAWLSPDKQHIFGYILQNDGLSAAIYALDGSPITSPQPFLDSMRFTFDLGEKGVLQQVWSHDSTQVVFNDQWGNLWLANINGSTFQLSAKNPLPDKDHLYYGWYYWSPDDTHMLVTSNDRAWIVYLPKSVQPGTALTLASLRMTEPSTGWGIDASGNLLRTADGGQNWVEIKPVVAP
jgi:hypothetical protein